MIYHKWDLPKNQFDWAKLPILEVKLAMCIAWLLIMIWLHQEFKVYADALLTASTSGGTSRTGTEAPYQESTFQTNQENQSTGTGKCSFRLRPRCVNRCLSQRCTTVNSTANPNVSAMSGAPWNHHGAAVAFHGLPKSWGLPWFCLTCCVFVISSARFWLCL